MRHNRFMCGAATLTSAAIVSCAVLTTSAHAQVQPHPGMLQNPDVSSTDIVFVYANNLWLASREGGMARPLASPAGREAFPRFSDDGQTIAFMGNYDGDRDLYTIDVNGVIPNRVTHHPSNEQLNGWTPDGGLIFTAFGIEGMPRRPQLFTVDADGGLPTKLPVPYGAVGAISSDGTWLAYTPWNRDARSWKRYRGGMASDIWLFNLNTHESKQITDWEGTDSQPMWHRDNVYYISDAGDHHRLNIWKYDTSSGKREQITRFSDYDVKWPSIGPGENNQGEIVFQNGADLYLLNLRTRQSRVVPITIPGARPTLRTKQVDVSKNKSWFNISPTGKRALVTARGDIWSCPAEHGTPRNLTRTDGAAERDCSWSPDGRWVAYFSDESGEYELHITQSDGKGETKQLTEGSETFYNDPSWSPDSKYITFTDKAGKLYLHTIESEETIEITDDPWGVPNRPSWSHDSQWLTYSQGTEDSRVPIVFLYNVETNEKHELTSGMFPDVNPTFDRKGEYLYYASSRSFQPTYSDLDTTWVYNQSQVLIAVPLRENMDQLWAPKSDEETWEDTADEDSDDDADDNGDADDEDEAETDDENGKDNGNGDDDEADVDRHPLHGVWEGTVSGLREMLKQVIPPNAGIDIPDTASITFDIVVDEDGNITGTSTTELLGQVESEPFGDITFNEETGEFTERNEKNGVKSVMKGVLEGDTITGTWEVTGAMNGSGTWSVTKTDKEPEETEEVSETVEIDIEGFESRAVQLPVSNGNFGNMTVNDKNQLIYVRASPTTGAQIMLFDITDDSKAEKTVASGAGSFEISADGKKLLVAKGGGWGIQNAAAGGSSKNIVTSPMIAHINPRHEWQQIFNDAWRFQRDYFYVENMHGVDWDAVREQYAAMLDDCVTREDLSYIISEMISELNIGHAYYFGGDVESEPSTNVGLLGVDWELHDGAYRIKTIHRGGPWDTDAIGPLSQPGMNVREGDYLLAVNGIPVDTSEDPWAPFIGLAGKTITITVNSEPTMEEDADDENVNGDEETDDEGEDDGEDEIETGLRDSIVVPVSNEYNLRYRSWIEANRKYVAEQTDGKVGYIYVPNTGLDGQSDLFRQFVGQTDKAALIIDERWNGGGQIPTRFIELLNRPATNYWATRDTNDWRWPPDSHQGPKCMLINGLAGSGGDMFPWLFRQAGLGPLIGMRTWGGLVGISGNPALIDGGYTSVPTFGFYENDGTWGVEGHGVDPDIRVVDDPALMVDGGDPQLDKAIEVMLAEIKNNPYVPPTPPAAPNRSGMGLEEQDK